MLANKFCQPHWVRILVWFNQVKLPKKFSVKEICTESFKAPKSFSFLKQNLSKLKSLSSVMNGSTEYQESYNDSTKFDELHYLSQFLGPQRQPMKTLVPLTIVYVVMSITGIFGNLSVCCVILRIPSMRSATNYYLFSLAVSDLLILLLGMSRIQWKSRSIHAKYF